MTKSLGYKDAIRFLNQFDNITYPEFDYYSVTNINLFTSLEAVDFKEIDGHITEIEKTLGAIKRKSSILLTKTFLLQWKR